MLAVNYLLIYKCIYFLVRYFRQYTISCVGFYVSFAKIN